MLIVVQDYDGAMVFKSWKDFRRVYPRKCWVSQVARRRHVWNGGARFSFIAFEKYIYVYA